MNERRPSAETDTGPAGGPSAEPVAEPQWVHGHAHEPNLETPGGDGDFVVYAGDSQVAVTLQALAALPYVEVGGCLIVSTGHGVSGPFTFGGVRLRDLLAWVLPQAVVWRHVDVVSADGFGTRVHPHDLDPPQDGGSERPVLLAYRMDGAPLSRRQGVVRLVVPSEVDDALRQVKWVASVRVV